MSDIELSQLWQLDPAVQRLTLDQVKAVVDAMAIGIYADLEAHPREEETFKNLLLSLPCDWEELEDLEGYVEESKASAATVNTRATLEQEAIRIARTLPNDVRPQVYSMICGILQADLKIRAREQAVLAIFAKTFGINPERAALIFAHTLEELGLGTENAKSEPDE